MGKTFVDLTNEVASKVFQSEKIVDGVAKPSEIDPQLQAIIDSGISAAIPRTLYLMMEKDPKEEVTLAIGPFTYGISIRKSGDSLSLNPTFALTNEKKTLNELGEYEEKLKDNVSLIETISQTIKDETFINTVIHCCKLDEYDTTKGEWIEKVNDADKGVELDQYAVMMLVAIHVATILHVLANTKNADEVVKYEVPGEGTYTIQRIKDKWEVGFVADKEFKQTIKNDRLIHALS